MYLKLKTNQNNLRKQKYNKLYSVKSNKQMNRHAHTHIRFYTSMEINT